jgi:hypothetical protein
VSLLYCVSSVFCFRICFILLLRGPVFLTVMFSFPPNDYMRYLPRFNRDGVVTVEYHLSSFYSFADNFNVEHADVWMRLFV